LTRDEGSLGRQSTGEFPGLVQPSDRFMLRPEPVLLHHDPSFHRPIFLILVSVFILLYQVAEKLPQALSS
jgi:hypothetical protein